MPATLKVPKRKGGAVGVVKAVSLYGHGTTPHKFKPGAVGVVTRREYDHGGYNVALMDQTGEVQEIRSGYRYEITFPVDELVEVPFYYESDTVTVKVTDGYFADGYLKVGR